MLHWTQYTCIPWDVLEMTVVAKFMILWSLLKNCWTLLVEKWNKLIRVSTECPQVKSVHSEEPLSQCAWRLSFWTLEHINNQHHSPCLFCCFLLCCSLQIYDKLTFLCWYAHFPNHFISSPFTHTHNLYLDPPEILSHIQSAKWNNQGKP